MPVCKAVSNAAMTARCSTAMRRSDCEAARHTALVGIVPRRALQGVNRRFLPRTPRDAEHVANGRRIELRRTACIRTVVVPHDRADDHRQV